MDGCFWHRCPDHATDPKANGAWWGRKLNRNVERDRETDRRLVEAGWRVIRIWEHEHLDEAISKVVSALDRSKA